MRKILTRWVEAWNRGRDRRAAARLVRRGYAVLHARDVEAAVDETLDTWAYVDRSGHLNTVSGRRPRSVHRVVSALEGVAARLRPAFHGLKTG